MQENVRWFIPVIVYCQCFASDTNPIAYILMEYGLFSLLSLALYVQ